MRWFEHPVGVPFGNANYDVGLGGSHDMTFLTPPNTEIFQLVPGKITDISSPSWGEQVTIEMDQPIEGHAYFAILHLAAVNPELYVGMEMQPNMIVGWSGGCVQSNQYNGTSNPTGRNFCDGPAMSSQPQVGIALCDGPGYGYKGWKTFPPIDTTLDPMPVVERYLKEFQPQQPDPGPDYKLEQFKVEWTSIVKGLSPDTGIARAAYTAYVAGNDHGPALTKEIPNWVDWNGRKVICQILATGMYYWYNNKAEWYGFRA